LKNLSLAAESVPTVPDIPQALRSTERSRVAWIFVVVTSLLLPLFMGANAMMTGLVLSEFLPPVQPFFGVPVAFVIAGVIVLVEAAIGVFHAAEAESREGTERVVTIWGLVLSLAAVAVVVVEALLYGLVDAEEIVKIPIAGSVFGLVGALLGLAVFGAGKLWNGSLITIRKERTPRTVKKQLDALRDAADEWNAAAEDILPRQQTATAAFEQLVQLAKDGGALQTSALTQLMTQLDRFRHTKPAWATANDRELTEMEFAERESRTYLWLAVLTVSAAVLGALGHGFAIRITTQSGMWLGLGLAMLNLALGAFGAQIGPKRGWRRVIMHVVFAAISFGIVALLGRFLRGQLTFHSAALLAPAIACYLAGAQTGADVTLYRMPILFVWRLFTLALIMTFLFLCWFLNVLTALVEYVLRIIGWPTMTIVNAFRERATKAPAVV
jgi:hypothetical protein